MALAVSGLRWCLKVDIGGLDRSWPTHRKTLHTSFLVSVKNVSNDHKSLDLKNFCPKSTQWISIATGFKYIWLTNLQMSWFSRIPNKKRLSSEVNAGNKTTSLNTCHEIQTKIVKKNAKVHSKRYTHHCARLILSWFSLIFRKAMRKLRTCFKTHGMETKLKHFAEFQLKWCSHDFSILKQQKLFLFLFWMHNTVQIRRHFLETFRKPD